MVDRGGFWDRGGNPLDGGQAEPLCRLAPPPFRRAGSHDLAMRPRATLHRRRANREKRWGAGSSLTPTGNRARNVLRRNPQVNKSARCV